MRVGIIAPKNTPEEVRWLAAGIDAGAEPYLRGRRYDVVLFFNLTGEIEFIKEHTDFKAFGIAIDSDAIHKPNSNPRYVDMCDYYMGYKDFSSASFRGEFRRLVYPAATIEEINEYFDKNISSNREYTFAMFAKHDPNIRAAIGRAIEGKNSLLLGELFDNPVRNKMEYQVRAKFEFITENVINDYYFSEKLPQALLAGCVPIYYGWTRVKELVPDDLFIDLADFSNLDEVLEYCSDESTYSRHFNAIRARARRFLLEHSTFDSNIFGPLNSYLGKLHGVGYRSVRRDLIWRAARLKSAVMTTIARRAPCVSEESIRLTSLLRPRTP
jgi:Glycosyltransferase family 10 (fucosyltransferase) C-term